MHVSNSEIQTFKRCRRKWYLAYYRKLRTTKEYKTGALMLGTRVHEALAVFYDLQPQDPVAYIKKVYEDAVNELDPEDAATRDDLNKEASLATIMVEGYVEWVAESGVDDDLDVLSTETEIAVDFKELPVTLIGKLDTRVRRRSNQQLFSMDHKTCADFGGLTRTLQLGEQPLMYQLLERMSSPEGEHVSGGLFNMLRKVKRTAKANPPFYMREFVHHNEHELRNFYLRLYGTLQNMIKAEEDLNNGVPHHIAAYPTPNRDCSWDCDFYAVCQMFDDGSRIEDLLATAYKVHDPYKRYESGVI